MDGRPRGRLARISAVLRRASRRRRAALRSVLGPTRLLTVVVFVITGLMVAVSALNARGTDLRPGRNTDLVSLVQAQARRNNELTRSLTRLRSETDALGAQAGSDDGDASAEVSRQEAYASLSAVRGPSLTVTLDDAPATVAADGIEPDLLVVHQQDIQAVVNALWAGGAEAMTIQGQRVISTTGIKCVGNTVVLHGVPYAPPYVVSALGNPAALAESLERSDAVRIYREYVDAYGMVLREQVREEQLFAAYEGPLDLQFAQRPGRDGGE